MTALSTVTSPGGSPTRRAVGAARSDGGSEDALLLARFTQSHCHEAFEQIVQRHAGWVQSLVRRKIKDRHLAEDVTQAVFVILARKAHTIRQGTVLSAWLFRVARFATRDALKHEMRRTRRWQRVAQMQADQVEDIEGESARNRRGTRVDRWAELDADLDDAIACLSESDRQVILLRFYEDNSMAEIAIAMGIAESAAKQRVSRALKRLRALLARRGTKVASMGCLLAMLRAAHPTKAAVLPSSHAIALAGMGKAEASGQSLRIAQSTLRSLAGAQCRIWAAMSGGALAATVVLGVLSPVLGRALINPILQHVRSAATSIAHQMPLGSGIVLAPSSVRPVPLTKIWVGQANQGAWPVLPLDAPRTILPLRSLSGSNAPVAIAQDTSGQYWYRKLEAQPDDPSLVSHLRDLLDMDIDRQLSALAADSHTMDGGWIEHSLDYFHAASIAAAVQGSDWQIINTPPPEPGGPVIVPFSDVRNAINDGLSGGTLVPEPAGLLVLGACALMLSRRRRAINR